jgi:hypothetical protein
MSQATVLCDADGVEYRQQSYCRAADTWTSREDGVRHGDVRVLNRKLYYAMSVYRRRFFTDKVIWCPVEAKP